MLYDLGNSGYITDYGLNILAEKLKVFEGKNLKNLSLYLNRFWHIKKL